MKQKKVLFLLPYPLQQAPSQRFRMEAFFPYLKEAGIDFRTQVFINDKGWKHLYNKGSYVQKISAVALGFLKRCWMVLFGAWQYDFIVVHREAAPLGPPFFEWWLAKIGRKRIIFDFDDAIWIPAITEGNKIASLVKCFWKIKWICKWSYKIVAGNEFLADYARQHNANVFIIPTCVDTTDRFNRLVDQAVSKPTIGWTGSHSTLKYLDLVYPFLRKLEDQLAFDFLVICNKPPTFTLRSLRYKKWSEITEIQDLAQINIGLMPLLPDAWSEGKCGFKIIQYLALGIPAVASPVGVNKHIIEEGINGFLCTAEEEWIQAIKELLQNSRLRAEMGRQGREKMITQFSVQANFETFLRLFI